MECGYLRDWTGNSAMVIIFAPHLEVVSHVHGHHIYEIGYHVLPYFLQQWTRFEHIPLGVLAHSTHVKGDGEFQNGVEIPRANVTLASRISEEDCKQIALCYQNPEQIDITAWKDREEDGILCVPKAGEILYRMKDKKT